MEPYEDTFNQQAGFQAMTGPYLDPNSDGSLPYLTVAGVRVYAYFSDGVLRLRLNLDAVDPAVLNAQALLPYALAVGDSVVWQEGDPAQGGHTGRVIHDEKIEDRVVEGVDVWINRQTWTDGGFTYQVFRASDGADLTAANVFATLPTDEQIAALLPDESDLPPADAPGPVPDEGGPNDA
jgi:hypothetical protein